MSNYWCFWEEKLQKKKCKQAKKSGKYQHLKKWPPLTILIKSWFKYEDFCIGIIYIDIYYSLFYENEWRISKEGQFWKLETWEHGEHDREKYIIFYK